MTCLTVAAAEKGKAGEYLVYVGTYTGEKSKGIYALRFDTRSGKLSEVSLAGETENPSFLTVHPNRKWLYAVGEVGNWQGKKTGVVTAFSIEPGSGKLTALNQVDAQGTSPCYITVDETGKYALIANYGTGSVAVFPIGSDGKLAEASSHIQHEGSSVDPKRQRGPHAHSIKLSDGNRFAVAADLGMDKLLVYKFDAKQGKLTPNDPPFATLKPGSGPRHFAWHPNDKFAYVLGEMTSTLTALNYDSKRGAFSEITTVSTLPGDFSGDNSTAEVVVHPSGKFVYGSNRGHNSIAVFSIDRSTGKPSLIENASTQGDTPRNFNIDPTGSFLIAANQRTDNLVVFRIDQNTGKLTPTGETAKVGSPVCIRFMALK
jgi:6-phosphogluconolactonase